MLARVEQENTSLAFKIMKKEKLNKRHEDLHELIERLDIQTAKKVAPNKPIGKNFCRSREWAHIRLKAIKLHGKQCMCCGSWNDTQVDHIKPKSRYPELALTLSNLQILCWNCNNKKGSYKETDYRETTK